MVSTTRGGLTDARGQYTLSNVPVGQYTLRVENIGYATQDRAITVVATETVIVNFELSTRALELEGIVVTGTPGGTQRRAVGNVVERVDVTSRLRLVPASDVQKVLAFRSPGVSVLPSQGEVGSGGAIIIRGVSSLGLSSQPIVYVDGVRINSSFGGGVREGGGNMSRMNDINPEDIESIEIIKGPAAATLYGTEASAGVIQIFTKKGVEGEPRFDFTVSGGTSWYPNPAGTLGESYALDEQGKLISFNLYEHEEKFGLGPVFQNGNQLNYSASATGGTARTRYFLSAAWDDQVGVVDYNWLKTLRTRSNISVMPRQDLTFSLNTTYVKNTQRKWQGFPDDIYRSLLWGGPDRIDTRTRGFNRRTPEAFRDDVENMAALNRILSAFTADHTVGTWFKQKLTFGIDVTNEANSILVKRSPLGASGIFGSRSLGVKRVYDDRTEVITFDYAATAKFSPAESVTTATSFGVQYFRRAITNHYAEGQVFPAPGFETVSSGAVTSAREDYMENKTIGTFVQEELGWRNRLFVTGAVRLDDNSAFGAQFDAAVYPKISATWVVHEEPFFNNSVEWVNQFRLRAAYGAAGRQPDVFDAPRLYDPVTGPGDQAGITPGSFGNPNLKPERSAELEVGFDAGLFDDRIAVEYTYYHRNTTDAITRVLVAPSTGFPGSQVLNVGKLKNWGHEIGVTARLIQGPERELVIGFQASLMRNLVEDIGDVEFIHVGGSRSATEHRVGYPAQSVFYKRIMSAELQPDGSTKNEMCDGGTGPDGARKGGALVPCADAPTIYWGRGANPTWESAVWSTLSLGGVTLHAQVDGRGGHMFMENDNAAAHTSFTNTSWSNTKENAVFQAYRKIGREPLAFTNGGFIRLRDVSVAYAVPSRWSDKWINDSRLSFVLAMRNVALLWQEQTHVKLPDGSVIPDPKVKDPERRFTEMVGSFHQALMPPLRSVTLTMRVSF